MTFQLKPLQGHPLTIQNIIDKLLSIPLPERHRFFFVDHRGFYDCAVTLHLDNAGDVVLNGRLFEGESERISLGRKL